jgi:2-dehydropantoate 2-reductase
VLDHSTDMLVGNETGLSLVRRIMGEVVAAATADGARLAPDIIDRQLTHTQTMGAYQSSMQVDRRAGRPLEVEAILGEPARRARQLGVATPTLEILYEMARLTDRAIRQTGGTAA